ncbi:hypothetical protein ACFHW2_14065 [Actinomadura sp. LOL_016]|uniref:hypothetical protein n=1 Tax=unclassified Actinomadura TaxID=2626254 RepID=UPI003A8117EB
MRDKRWQATTGFKSGVIISWFVMLPLSWIVLMQDLETSTQVAVIGDGRDARIVVRYAGDDRPIDGPGWRAAPSCARPTT